MRKYLFNALVVSMAFFLASCETSGALKSADYSIFNPEPVKMTLTQSVQDALMRSNDPVIAQVHVETNQQMVILSGYVRKIRQSDTAEQIARQVPGVQQVENRMIVRQ